MPRKRRLEFPGEIHHVMARGLDGMPLFSDDSDKQQLLDYLAKYIPLTGCKCYAWSILDNHYHLLLRTGSLRLGETILRIHTSYSQYFNRIQKRRGYVFQDRYKSIVTADHQYIRWLIAYIHLNPLRAGMVKSLGQLETYHWSSHRFLIRNELSRWFSTMESLRHFGSSVGQAINEYKSFLESISSINNSEDPVSLLKGSKNNITSKGLGQENEEFASLAEREAKSYRNLQNEFKDHQKNKNTLLKTGWDLDRLADYVCRLIDIEKGDLLRRGHGNKYTIAKALFCHWSYRDLGISMKEIGRYLKMGNSGVSKLAEHGRQLVLKGKYVFNSV